MDFHGNVLLMKRPMKKVMKYDPEDIESLLMHKEFSDLYPEEKEFVLRHIDSPSEYSSLRKTLIEVMDASKNDPWLDPDPEIRENLLAQLAREDKKGFTVWLNSLFAAPQLPWFRQPAFRYATVGLAVVAVIATIWVMNDKPEADTLAQKDNPTYKEEQTTITPLDSAQSEEVLIAENVPPVSNEKLPPVPQIASIQFTPIELMEEEVADSGYINKESNSTEALGNTNNMNSDEAVPEILIEQSTSKVATKSILSAPEMNHAAAPSINYSLMETEVRLASLPSTSSESMEEWDSIFNVLYTAP